MMWRGAASTTFVLCFFGISYVLTSAVGESAQNNLFNNTNVATTREVSLFDTPESSGAPTLKGQSNTLNGVSQRHHIMRQRRKRRRSKKKRKKKRPNNGRRPGNPPGINSTPGRQPARLPAASDSSPRLPSSSSCFTIDDYDSIDRDIGKIKNNIRSDKDRSHFLGGIVRLAAHDFMDFDRRSGANFGPDGCFDANHPSNDGLETIWCRGCPLKILYDEKYSHLSRADYWIAAANAVIRQTSIDNRLDLKDTFVWGRKDRDVCRGSGDRLPEASGCSEVEDVFLRRMGLDWHDAVALLGAHTLGRGDRDVSA